MNVFSYFADKTIRSSNDGRRILAIYGPFARPYDVSSPDTEERVVRRLVGAYRVLVIPVLALVLFQCRWPNKHTLFAGLGLTAVVGWLVAWTILYPDLRRLKRVDRPSQDRAASAEFVRQLCPSDRALLRRRRLFLAAMFLISCAYVAGGLMVNDNWWFGYANAGLFGCGGIMWARMFFQPAETVLGMRSSFFSVLAADDMRARARTSETHGSAKQVPAKPDAQTLKWGVWDRELDGRP